MSKTGMAVADSRLDRQVSRRVERSGARVKNGGGRMEECGSCFHSVQWWHC